MPRGDDVDPPRLSTKHMESRCAEYGGIAKAFFVKPLSTNAAFTSGADMDQFFWSGQFWPHDKFTLVQRTPWSQQRHLCFIYFAFLFLAFHDN
jgi:hypothetical protein